jgi:hypothetical protein
MALGHFLFLSDWRPPRLSPYSISIIYSYLYIPEQGALPRARLADPPGKRRLETGRKQPAEIITL